MARRPRATPRREGERPLTLELEPALAQAVREGRPLAAHFAATEGLVLLPEAAGLAGFFAGDLASLPLEGAFAHVVSGVRSGLLVVSAPGLKKTVRLRDGQVVWATSSEPHERLGALLVRLGLVTQAQLTDALGRVGAGARIGQVLTREGVVSEANLYNAMTLLVREVVVDLFATEVGSFLFLEGARGSDESVKLPERTRDLVLAGLKRQEAVAALRRRYPDGLGLALAEGQGRAPAPGEEALWARAARGASVGELRPHFDGSLFAFLTWVDERVREGALAPAAAPAPAAVTLPPALPPLAPEARYDALLRAVVRALAEAGEGPDALEGFLAEPPEAFAAAYAGVRLAPDGTLDVARLFDNLAAEGPPARVRARVLEALDAFASYALFTARNVLPPAAADALHAAHRALQEAP